MTGSFDVFLSYSRNDQDAATLLCGHLERHGLTVFKDDKSIRWSERWLDKLQEAVEGCRNFVVLVGRDGVRRWIGAETHVALIRHFGPHDDEKRLPIFPLLLSDTRADALPAFLNLFQAHEWTGIDPLPTELLNQISGRISVTSVTARIEGCPYVGLAAYTPKQAHLFFGRQKETLHALSYFNGRRGGPPVRWLQIEGNSGSGKSSLMNAGLLPLIGEGLLWRRTGFECWIRIGPMMPGVHPVDMLAEHLARAFSGPHRQEEMADIRHRLESSDDRALAEWLRGRKSPDNDTAFLLALDQFEELFTFAEEEQRRRFDRLLSAALEDPDCPLFVISTVRSDFLNHVEILPRLVSARNEIGRSWTLAPMGTQALREVVDGPARLAALEVGEIRDWIVSESEGEPGALPLVENALAWLWETRSGNRLSGQQFRSAGGIAGILVRSADDLLASMDDAHRTQALELLFRLVKVDSEGYRHARRRLPFAQAVEACGGGEEGRGLLYRLAGGRGRGDGMGGNGVRLITVTEDTSSSDVEVAPADQRDGRAVSLIHETLIRSKDADGKPQPYWPTLWNYIEKNKERATWRERLREDVATWVAKGRSPGLQWSLERVREAAKALRPVIPELSRDEREFLGSIDPRAMVAELQRSETTHMRRLIIGERLDVLGDPRPGVASGAQGLPDIAWCEVEGRTLTIDFRRNPNDPCSAIIGSLARSVRPFRISRYPITVAQYRAFVEANDGWDDPASWSGGLYRDPEGRSYHFGRFGNSPATYVSWFDAVAFCRWLSRRSALTIRLPDEWEWQQAATGGDIKNLYPWGAGWIQIREPYRANILESGLGGATAVGMYPDGASPAGALDMAGTVWEWCIDEHDFPGAVSSQDLDRYDASETTGPGFNRMVARVLRGGSWFDLQDFARSKFRFRSMPTNRNATIGFRVVCSSTFSPIDH